MLMSSGSMKSPMRTSAVIAWPDSFTPPSVAMCEWQSMMPGEMCLPWQSMIVVPIWNADRFLRPEEP